ncbi:MAG: alpha/beta hydrolase [Peptococcaceae bacterium]|nr:alpha/beta hydrolase [Peptococcaceae bacterium]
MKTVFLHGLGQGPEAWRQVLQGFGEKDAMCPNLYGLTSRELSYERLLGGLERCLKMTDAPLRLCGLSLGAMLALDYTIRHSDRVAELVLIGAQVKSPTRLIDAQNMIFRLLPARAFSLMGISKQDVMSLTRSMRSLDFSDKLGKISCPVTIVIGQRDRANRKAAEALHQLLPQSTLHIIPGAGHEVNLDAPQALVNIL